MATTAGILVLVDRSGRVVAAELSSTGKGASKRDEPTGNLAALESHRAFSVDVPREILSLSGPDLHRYFGEAQITRDGRFRLPKIKVASMHTSKK